MFYTPATRLDQPSCITLPSVRNAIGHDSSPPIPYIGATPSGARRRPAANPRCFPAGCPRSMASAIVQGQSPCRPDARRRCLSLATRGRRGDFAAEGRLLGIPLLRVAASPGRASSGSRGATGSVAACPGNSAADGRLPVTPLLRVAASRGGGPQESRRHRFSSSSPRRLHSGGAPADHPSPWPVPSPAVVPRSRGATGSVAARRGLPAPDMPQRRPGAR
jgi:hypothetical protein